MSQSAEQWYDDNLPAHDALTDLLGSTVKRLVDRAGVDYLAVTARTKDRESFLAKASEYQDPTREIFDVCAVRVIAYVDADRRRLVEALRNAFKPIEPHCVDKTAALGVEKTGYRGVHLVCEFGEDRCKAPEFADHAGRRFEIQLQTVLEHAWAQITHDRQYKFAGVLRQDLDRRMNVLAGVLELADSEFGRIADEVDAYATEIKDKAATGDLSARIDSTSLRVYLQSFLAKTGRPSPRMNEAGIVTLLLTELETFGVHTLADLPGLLSPEILSRVFDGTRPRFSTVAGLLRTAMLVKDMDTYFERSWQGHWEHCWGHMYRAMVDKWGAQMVDAVLVERRIRIG